MKYRHYQYGKQNAGRYFLTILLMLVGWNAYASSVNTIDTVSIAKTLDDVVNRVILETESGNLRRFYSRYAVGRAFSAPASVSSAPWRQISAVTIIITPSPTDAPLP